LEKAPDAFRTISEVADDLDVPQHVLRFWESRFAQIKPMKRGGGRRYYRPDDIDLLRGIRFLLYGEGYTIRGVQRILKEQGVRFVQSVWQEGAKQLELRRGIEARDDEDGEEETRGRSLMGLLSPFQERDAEQDDSDEDDEDDELEDEDGSAMAQAEPRLDPAPLRLASDPLPTDASRAADKLGAPRGLTREDLHRLQATLRDLSDCRRLLDAALKQDDM
jgi:DNA-binding transcriptional MerR regulator